MASSLEDVRTSRSGIPPSRRKQKEIEGIPVPDDQKNHPLDGDEAQERLRKLMQWRRQARIAQADNRTEMATDEDFYDGIQYTPEDLNILINRNQAPLVYNVTKNTINWILGTERKQRIDFRVLPRKKKGAQSAKIKTKMFKYINDVNKGEYMRSLAFEDSVKAGLGWIELGARSIKWDEPIFIRRESWRNVWFDHLCREPDGRDQRFLFREKWVDLDVAIGMFPERGDRIKVQAESVNSMYPYLPDDVVITDWASEFDLESDLSIFYGGPWDGARQRVKLIEAWYRMPQQVKIMQMRDEDTPYGALDGAIYRPEWADHKYLVEGNYFTTFDVAKMVVRHAIWIGNTFLQDALSPYNHDRFPFIPFFCYRRQRDGQPYGVIRDIRDPQDDLNKRRSRSLFLLTAKQVIAEPDAVNNKVEASEEIHRPDGWIEVNPGKKFEIVDQKQLAKEHVELARDDERFIQNIAGGTTEEGLGHETNAISGKAIEARETHGLTTSGVVFDNYYYAFQLQGEVLNALVEQFKDQADEIRVTGDTSKDEFIEINKWNAQKGEIENSITESKADFYVGKQDYRESLRISMMEKLSDLVGGLSKSMPEVALKLLDLVVDCMDDFEDKDEMVSRIREINKQHAPEDEMTDEEKEKLKAQKEKAAQEQAAMKQMQDAMIHLKMALEQGKVQNEQAKAFKLQIDGQVKRIEGFLKAMEAATALMNNPAVVAAADRLIKEAEKPLGGEDDGKKKSSSQVSPNPASDQQPSEPQPSIRPAAVSPPATGEDDAYEGLDKHIARHAHHFRRTKG
jgi:hypothetical protein